MRKTLFQAACVTVPKALGGVLTIVLNAVLLTRMTPAEFGVYAVCLTLVTLAEAVVGSAVDMSAVKLATTYRLNAPRRAAAAEQWALLVKLAITGLVLCVVLPLATPVADALFHRIDEELLVLALAVSGGVLAMRSISTHLQLAHRFGAYAGLELFAQTMRVCGIGAVLLWWQPSANTLTLAALTGTAAALLVGMRIGRLRWQGWRELPLRWADGRELMHAMRWMLVTVAFSALLARADVLLLTRWSTIDQVGLFAAAQVFALIPELLGMWLAVVFSPKVEPARASGALRRVMAEVQLALGVLAVVMGLAAWAALHWAGDWLPVRYAASADVLLPLVVGGLAGMFALPFTVPYIMFTRPSFVLMYDLCSLPLLLLAYHWAITHSGALGAAYVSGGTRIIKVTVLQACAWLWARPAVAPLLNPAP